ncbi:MAG: hypothetical protein H6581_29540 [Bacteroidia bacterium]|nr:hypothetical protein [Bacteroidia bacterium]
MKKSYPFALILLGLLLGLAPQMEAQMLGIPGIEVFVKMEPTELTMATRKEFSITLGAKNVGKETKDPNFTATRLEINGLPSPLWDSVVDNGKRPDEWFKLPPGKSIALAWGSIGYNLFRAPGTYELKFFHFQKEIKTVTVTVAENPVTPPPPDTLAPDSGR